METKQIDQLLMANASKLPPEGVALLRERLMNVEDTVSAQVAFSQLKDPTIALILSIIVCLSIKSALLNLPIKS